MRRNFLALPVRINLPAQARQAEGITLQTPCQDSNSDHQQQSIDPLRFAQAAALQLEHPQFLILEELLTAKALLVASDQIEIGSTVADQKPLLLHRQA